MVQNFENLRALKSLDLSYNKISEIDGNTLPQYLERLNLKENEITQTSNLDNLTLCEIIRS